MYTPDPSCIFNMLRTRDAALTASLELLAWQVSDVPAEGARMQRGQGPPPQSHRQDQHHAPNGFTADLPKDSATWGSSPGSAKSYLLQAHQVGSIVSASDWPAPFADRLSEHVIKNRQEACAASTCHMGASLPCLLEL